MRTVYEASTGLDAHMILNLLEQQRIAGHIEGEYLQGGVGGLQAMGLVRVLVDEQDYVTARKIIDEWEANQPALENTKAEAPAIGGIEIFVIGVVVGAWVMYWLLNGQH